MIDHLVYCVPDLEKAMDTFEELSGLRPVFGGYHTTQGTKNALVRLSSHSYLELLAVDDENQEVRSPRWMGIDLIKGPKLTRWALKSTNIIADADSLKNYHPKMGRITGGQRSIPSGEQLRWEIIMPLSDPEIEAVPFLLDWSKSSAYPANGLKEGCKLMRLEIFHPAPKEVEKILQKLPVANEVAVFSGSPKLQATLSTPNGIVVLS